MARFSIAWHAIWHLEKSCTAERHTSEAEKQFCKCRSGHLTWVRQAKIEQAILRDTHSLLREGKASSWWWRSPCSYLHSAAGRPWKQAPNPLRSCSRSSRSPGILWRTRGLLNTFSSLNCLWCAIVSVSGQISLSNVHC